MVHMGDNCDVSNLHFFKIKTPLDGANKASIKAYILIFGKGSIFYKVKGKRRWYVSYILQIQDCLFYDFLEVEYLKQKELEK